jgi:ETFB lysine methyltransferase
VSDRESLEVVEASLRRRYRVVETPIEINGGTFAILHPASAEELIDERDFERDERLPYWAELWPSSRVLGQQVMAMRGNGQSLLELGCGSGLVAACAAAAGFSVTVSDYYEDACRFARVNVTRNGGAKADALLLDWRHLPASLGPYDIVLAADVLYERPYGALVARAIAAALGPRGLAYVADPGRVGREEFIAALGPSGLRVVKQRGHRFADGPVRQTIEVYQIAPTNS